MPNASLSQWVENWRSARREKERREFLVNLVNRRYETGALRRRRYEKDWCNNIQFFAGNQWLHWDKDADTFVIRTDDKPSWSVRYTENRYLGLTMTTLSMLMEARREYRCIPASGSEDDRVAARLGDQIMRRADKMFDLRVVRQEFGLWLLLTGICGIDVQWDPDAGPLAPIIETDDDGQPLFAENEEPIFLTDARGKVIFDHEGDVRFVIKAPTNFIPQPHVTRPTDLQWYIYHTTRSIDYVKTRWPETSKDISPEDVGDNMLEGARLPSYFGLHGTFEVNDSDGQAEGDGDVVVVKEMVCAPCAAFPVGGIVWTAGTEFLEFQEGLDAHCLQGSHLGLFMARCFQVVGRFWPASAGDLMADVQKQINLTGSQIFEAKNLTMAGKWLVPRAANLAKHALNTRPGERVFYDYPFLPTRDSPAPIPRYVVELAQRLPYVMQELMRIHQATLGQAPRNLRSGLAIAEVQEQDELGWAPTGIEIDCCWERAMGRMLWLMQQSYVLEPRLLSLFNEDTDQFDVQTFLGSDLKGVADVEMVPGTGRRRSRVKMQAMVMEILQSQVGVMLMSDPQYLTRTMEALDLGHFATFFDTWQQDAAEARHEFHVLDNLDPEDITLLKHFLTAPPEEAAQMQVPAFLPVVHAYQNMDVHLTTHGDHLKTPGAREGDPALFEAEVRHFNAHLAMKMQMMMPPEDEEQPSGSKASSKEGNA